jgi:hypothetical protein
VRLSERNKFSIKPRLVFDTAGSATNRRVPQIEFARLFEPVA